MIDKKKMKVVDFYKDQDIFITGGLGFMGKVLIEKLLRSCPDLNRIFVLVRGQKNESPDERLQKMLTGPLFDLLKSQNSSAISKVMAIEGDVSLDGCGINDSDLVLMKNVSIVFHSAATIRFKEPFSQSILINTNGTYQVMEFAKKLKDIKAVVHVSTIFCNLNQEILEEKIYPAYGHWREMIELAKMNKDEILEKFVHNYKQYNHNNYTLSKHLAEQVANDYKEQLPIVVFRPSVVINTISEPINGWTDALSGPLALTAGVGTGLIRMTYADVNGYSELIAVDVAIKAMIVAAYKKGIEERSNHVDVYNCSETYHAHYITTVGAKIIDEHPFEKCLWYPSTSSTKCYYYFLFNFVLFQLLPAIVLDGILFLCGKRPCFVKIQKKIYNGIMAYHPFASAHFNFKCDKTLQLDRIVQLCEFDKFAFMHFHRQRFDVQFLESLKGFKEYFLQEPRESSQGAQLRFKILYFLDRFCKFTFMFVILRLLLSNDFLKRVFI